MTEHLVDEAEALRATLENAIKRRVLVEADFNRGRSLLAPHSVFMRHDEAYLRAQTVERDGRKPTAPKLGTFKLSGLGNVATTRKLFSSSLFVERE